MSAAASTARLLALVLGVGALGGIVLPAVVAGSPAPGAGSAGSAALTLPVPAPSPARDPRSDDDNAGDGPAAAGEALAVRLLRRAAAAGNERTYSGTQFVTSWSTAGTSSVVVDLQHAAGHGVEVRLSGAGGSGIIEDAAAATLDARALAVMERHYTLSVATQLARCAGRPARVVQARPRGSSAVAGRFWLDVATGLVLRRELHDRAGRTVRAAAFVDLQLGAPQPWVGSTHGTAMSRGSALDAAQITGLRRAGWQIPGKLSSGLELFDARTSAGALHLSYTDGLFAVSVFSQRGRLDPRSVVGWQYTTMAGTPAWTRPGLSQRVVWAGSDRVYTAVADAPARVVAGAVEAFPVAGADSFARRIARGLHRMGSWVDPRR